jgi:hypothetical protein
MLADGPDTLSDMNENASPVVVTLRLDRELAEGIRKSAASNTRTVSQELRHAARRHLQAQEQTGVSGQAA